MELNMFLEIFGDTDETKIMYYKTFLQATDFEMLKAFEKLFSEPTKFVANIVTLYKSYSEVIKWRVYARTQVEELEKK